MALKSVWHDCLVFMRLLLVCLGVLFLPRIFFNYFPTSMHGKSNQDMYAFKLGIENVNEDFVSTLAESKNNSYRAAIVTNSASQNQKGLRSVDILLEKGVPIKKIIAPQHGFFCDAVVGSPLIDCNDMITDIPIVSLHMRSLDVADVHDVDVIFFDLQDVGIQHYSYVSTLLRVMEVAAVANKTIIVLDRPNVLGDGVEGLWSMKDAIEKGFSVIPLRYGMTLGELALHYNNTRFNNVVQLHVVPMSHYNRKAAHAHAVSGKLSPNIKSLAACQGYSFLGLLGEVAPFDIGIGTEKSFQCILLPERFQISKQTWYELRSQLAKLGIDGIFYRYFSDRKKEYCSGLHIAIKDVNNFSLIKVLVATLDFFKAEGVPLVFSRTFNDLPGMKIVVDRVNGTLSEDSFKLEMQQSLESFFSLASKSFIYRPLPKLITT